MFAATKNRFLMQIMDEHHRRPPGRGLRRQGHHGPAARRRSARQYHEEFSAIIGAIAARKGDKAEQLVSDHLMRMLATINIWQ